MIIIIFRLFHFSFNEPWKAFENYISRPITRSGSVKKKSIPTNHQNRFFREKKTNQSAGIWNQCISTNHGNDLSIIWFLHSPNKVSLVRTHNRCPTPIQPIDSFKPSTGLLTYPNNLLRMTLLLYSYWEVRWSSPFSSWSPCMKGAREGWGGRGPDPPPPPSPTTRDRPHQWRSRRRGRWSASGAGSHPSPGGTSTPASFFRALTLHS